MTIFLNGYDFDGPYRLDQWMPPRQEGVFALLRRATAPAGTTSFTPIYFGETDDFTSHAFPAGHPRYAVWMKEAGGVANLYIGVHYMPGATQFLRKLVRGALLGRYHPTCNYAWPHGWAREKRDARD